MRAAVVVQIRSAPSTAARAEGAISISAPATAPGRAGERVEAGPVVTPHPHAAERADRGHRVEMG